MALRPFVTATTLLSLAATLLGPTSADAQARRRPDREPRPTLYRAGTGEWLLDLPPAMEDALDRYERDFEAWTQANYRRVSLPRGYEYTSRQVPWAAIGDFNDDGRLDVAIAGRSDRDLLVLMIVSNGTRAYRVVELDAEPYDPDDRRTGPPPLLRYMYPARYVVQDDRLRRPRELLLTRPAVQVTGARRPGAVLYVIENGKPLPYYLTTDPLDPPRPRDDKKRDDRSRDDRSRTDDRRDPNVSRRSVTTADSATRSR